MSLTAAVLSGYDSDRLALIGLVVLAVSLILLPLWVGTSRRLVPVSQVHRGRWTPLDLAAVVFAGVSALLLAPLLLEAGIGRSIEGASGEELQLFELFGSGFRVPLVGVQLLLQLVIFLAPAAVLGGGAATLEPRGWRALGIRPGGNRRACALGALGFALFLPAFLSLSWVWHWLLEALGDIRGFIARSAHDELAALTGRDLGYDAKAWRASLRSVKIVPKPYRHNAPASKHVRRRDI